MKGAQVWTIGWGGVEGGCCIAQLFLSCGTRFDSRRFDVAADPLSTISGQSRRARLGLDPEVILVVINGQSFILELYKA